MKSFMKLIVTLVVMGVLGFSICYLIMNNPKEENEIIPSDEPLEETKIEIVTSGEAVKNRDLEEQTISSGEENTSSGENLPEKTETVIEEVVPKINQMVEKTRSGEIVESLTTNFPEELLNEKAHDIMQYFEEGKLSVQVNLWENAMEVLPAPDFIENMFYLYDEKGDLLFYESTSTTVGGSSRYYFEEGKLLEVEEDYEEEVSFEAENATAILERAARLYEEFILQ